MFYLKTFLECFFFYYIFRVIFDLRLKRNLLTVFFLRGFFFCFLNLDPILYGSTSYTGIDARFTALIGKNGFCVGIIRPMIMLINDGQGKHGVVYAHGPRPYPRRPYGPFDWYIIIWWTYLRALFDRRTTLVFEMDCY